MSSHIQFESDKVVKLCDLFLAQWAKHVAALKEPHILKEMRPKLFGLIPAKTREEAIEILDKGSPFSKYCLVDLQTNYETNHIQNLKDMAIAAPRGVVFLALDDVKMLSKMINVESFLNDLQKERS